MTAPAGRFHLAFGQPSLTWAPVWTRIDSTPNLVTSIQIDRGRQYELDQTDTGTATVMIADRDGLLDPSNPSGPHYNQIEPLLQAAVCRFNPVTGTWHQRYRGFVETFDYTFDPSQQVNFLTVSLTDIFEFLSAVEMFPGAPGFGVTPPSSDSGDQVYYPPARMDGRIFDVLNDAIGATAVGTGGAGFAVVFSGNVNVKGAVYSPGESAMTPIQEAANAEFPGVSNVYTDRYGRLAVHGRLAKFDPVGVHSGISDPSVWEWHRWKAGDRAAVNASPGTAQLRRFAFTRGLAKIINQATATPMRGATPLTNAELVGQTVTDLASLELYGIRSWSALDLLTDYGIIDSTGDLQATRQFAEYIVQNYAGARDRITDIAFRPLDPADPRAPAVWALLSDIDISDEVTVTVTSPGGGGLNAEAYYVEGIHETVQPLTPTYDDVTLSLDLSPAAYFTSNPFPLPT